MEVWARVASFLPFSSLLDTFWALTNAGLLPDTGTNASNAFLQFCSEVRTEDEEERERSPMTLENYRLLLQMGFEADMVSVALRLCRGNLDATFDCLLYHM